VTSTKSKITDISELLLKSTRAFSASMFTFKSLDQQLSDLS
jgi:hypothetical protein